VSRLEWEELPRERLDGARVGARCMGVLGAAVSSEGGITSGSVE